MRIVLVGRGRVGRTMARLLADAVLVGRGEVIPEGDVCWLLVRDAELPTIRVPGDPIVLHASGGLSPEVLPWRERGVLHPLMTFPGPEIAIPALDGVPARIEGTPRAVEAARRIAGRLGLVPLAVPGDPRAYHAAASIASGHLAAAFLDAASTLASAGVSDPAAALLPLAIESVRRAAQGGPVAITGPFVREDAAMIAGHQEVLKAGPRQTYDVLGERIRSLRKPVR